MFPPMLLYLRVSAPDHRRFGIWLPLFLIWLMLLPLMVLVLVVTVLVDAVLIVAGHHYHDYTRLLFRCLGVLHATRGTTIRVRSNENLVDINLV